MKKYEKIFAQKTFIQKRKSISYYEGFDEMENIKDLLLELKRVNY